MSCPLNDTRIYALTTKHVHKWLESCLPSW